MTDHNRLIRVLLADDHLLVREGLKRLVNDQPDMKVLAEAGDGQEALRLAQERSPDVALVDVSMPGWDGVTLTQEMSRVCPALKIIAVTRHDDPGFVKRMIDAGASGYVLKQSATSTLASAVRACVAGEQFVDPGVRSSPGQVVSPSATPIAAPTSGSLTALEEEVLRLFGSAHSVRMIAERIGLTREEVARVKDEAMRKAVLTSRMEVINYMRSRGTK